MSQAAEPAAADSSVEAHTTQEGAPSVEQGASTPEERAKDLEGRLDASLSDFDGLLLREQEILAEQREAGAMGGVGGGGAADEGSSNGGGRGSRGDVEGTGDSSDARQEEGDATATGGSRDAPVERGEGAGEATEDETRAEEERGGRVPPDVGDGSDDDIVARQLREAAEKEEDPELRRRLWQEYRDYKSGEKRTDD